MQGNEQVILSNYFTTSDHFCERERGCFVFPQGKPKLGGLGAAKLRLGGLGAITVVCGRLLFTDKLWIFFMCTFRWSVRLKT